MRRAPRLKSTFIFALVTFSAVLSLTFAAVSAYRVAADLREELVRRGEVLTADLASEAVRFLAMTDPLKRELSLMLLTHRVTVGDVAYAQVVRAGEVVSESTQVEGAPLGIISTPTSLPLLWEMKRDSGRYLDFVRSLPEDTGQSYVRLGLSLEVVQRRVRQNLLMMAGLSFLFTSIGAALAFALYSAILKPLERLVGSFHRLAAGDVHARVQITGYKELEELAETFNGMADVITRRSSELQDANAELRSANRAKSEFLAMMGHELKTPLHSLRGYCQLLMEELDGPLTPEQRGDVEAVLGSGDHLLSLIDNILTFSGAGAEQLHITEVSLPTLLGQAVDHVRQLAHRKGLTLEVKADSTESVRADETKLKQVLINLLHNAVKYTAEGRVEVETSQDEKGVYIQINDTGPGIPVDEQGRIFEPFERFERGEPKELKGLGLGLAVVRRYVAAHGGRIAVVAAQGEGSRFRIFLPVIPEDALPGKSSLEAAATVEPEAEPGSEGTEGDVAAEGGR